jgi:hypothetical protein
MSNRALLPTRTALAAALTAQGAYGPVRAGDLVELPRRGLAHRHWRLRGKGVLLRAPLAGGSNAAAALGRQAEAFRRMSASGHAPRLHGVLTPTARLPGGALIVEEIRGRAPVVPSDFPALAAALAAIHALPMPPETARSPLPSPFDPFADTLAIIERHLESAWPSFSPELRTRLAAERDWARRTAAEQGHALRAGPRTLVVTDAHPRNFVLRADGSAVCVDLEKAMYGAPAIDLAHAMLPAAIAWGRQGERVTAADRDKFLNAYLKRRHASAEQALGPLFAVWQRLTRLRTTAAFAAFRAGGAGRVLGQAAQRLARRAIAQALDPKRLVITGQQSCANRLQKRD